MANTPVEKPTAEETALWQKRLASQANNHAWDLSENPSRTTQEAEEMLMAATLLPTPMACYMRSSMIKPK